MGAVHMNQYARLSYVFLSRLFFTTRGRLSTYDKGAIAALGHLALCQQMHDQRYKKHYFSVTSARYWDIALGDFKQARRVFKNCGNRRETADRAGGCGLSGLHLAIACILGEREGCSFLY